MTGTFEFTSFTKIMKKKQNQNSMAITITILGEKRGEINSKVVKHNDQLRFQISLSLTGHFWSHIF